MSSPIIPGTSHDVMSLQTCYTDDFLWIHNHDFIRGGTFELFIGWFSSRLAHANMF